MWWVKCVNELLIVVASSFNIINWLWSTLISVTYGCLAVKAAVAIAATAVVV